MQIIPAIDIKSGKCVRLYQGKFEQMTEYAGHPWEIAKAYAKAGANELHIVDLDGAKEGEAVQLSRVTQICQLDGLNVQIGGGIRSHRHIKILFADGASRVVIGSMAVTHEMQVKEWMNEFGAERVVLAFDVNFDKKGEPIVVTDAWQTQGKQSLWELIDNYTDAKYVLCTDITRDGTLQGPNLALYEKCQKRYPDISFQASGGIGSLEDLVALKKLKMYGAIVGKALFEKRFTLEEALQKVATC
jgi:phosphoribosylformimino-5-aminoimidazole carboxamide ribotide isomerase